VCVNSNWHYVYRPIEGDHLSFTEALQQTVLTYIKSTKA